MPFLGCLVCVQACESTHRLAEKGVTYNVHVDMTCAPASRRVRAIEMVLIIKSHHPY